MTSSDLLSSGNAQGRFLVLLDGPLAEADAEAGELLCAGSSAGRLFWRIAREAGIRKDDVQVVLVPEGDKVDDGVPFNNILTSIAGSAATTILALGERSLRCATGCIGITGWRGYLIDSAEIAPRRISLRSTADEPYRTSRRCVCHKPGKTAICQLCSGTGWKYRKGDPRIVSRWIEELPLAPRLAAFKVCIATHSPAAVHKSQLTLLPEFSVDIDRAARAANDKLVPVSESYERMSQNFETSTEPLVVDIETYYDGTIHTIGIANRTSTLSTDREFGFCLNQMRDTSLLIVHNTGFDLPALETKQGFMRVGPIWDTMLSTYMLNPDGKKGLNSAISLYCDARRHKHFADSDNEKYNALDARYTHELWKIHERKLHADGQLEFFTQGMMRALPTLFGMTARGILVDGKYRETSRAELLSAANDLKARYPHLPMSSPTLTARYFGLKRSADEEALLKLSAKSTPAVQAEIAAVLEFRDYQKGIRTYFKGYDDSVHPSYLPGARDDDEGNKGIAYSGRPTASNPNIQNQPLYARRMFIPRPGKKFASLDWSQIEPRITAALSGDDVLAADLDGDVYAAVANAAGCDRRTAKTVFLLSAYLGSPRTLQDKLMLKGVNLPYSECKALQDKLFQRYHRWFAWRAGIITTAKTQRALQNVFGKWAPFYRVHAAKAANFHPQSCAACILWYCLPEVERAISRHGGQIVTTVHDEIVIEAPPDKLGAASAAAKSVMMREWPQIAPGFRVPVNIKVGMNWADMAAEDSLWASYD